MSKKTPPNALDELQARQDWAFRLRDQYGMVDNAKVQWDTLTILWEAHRCAWYALHGDNAGCLDKLNRVHDAVMNLYASLKHAKARQRSVPNETV